MHCCHYLNSDWPLARFSLTEKSILESEEYNGKLQNESASKVVAVAYEKCSFTRGSNYWALILKKRWYFE